MKMYILVKDTVPLGLAMAAVGHACTCAEFQWGRNEPIDEYLDWRENSFRKVVCKVTPKQFEEARKFKAEKLIMRENNWGNDTTAIVFCPSKEPHKALRYYTLYR